MARIVKPTLIWSATRPFSVTSIRRQSQLLEKWSAITKYCSWLWLRTISYTGTSIRKISHPLFKMPSLTCDYFLSFFRLHWMINSRKKSIWTGSTMPCPRLHSPTNYSMPARVSTHGQAACFSSPRLLALKLSVTGSDRFTPKANLFSRSKLSLKTTRISCYSTWSTSDASRLYKR